MTEPFSGQTVIISGAMGDIGSAIALELAARGAHVALGDIRPAEGAAELTARIESLGCRARYDCVDVSDADAVSHWVQSVEGDLGVPSLIIPNAAIVTLKNARKITPAEWSREITVNLNGAFHLAQCGALRLLEAAKPGRIVFVGSWAAHVPHSHIPAYSAAKAGLRMLMKCMAKEFAPDGILVNEVAPGYVDAGLSGQIFRLHPEQRAAAAERTPTGILIQPVEVALQVAHLCDPSNRHMTGSVLLMDGGLSLGT